VRISEFPWRRSWTTRAGKASARDVLEAVLERIRAVEGASGRLLAPGEDPEALHRQHPGVHAFITLTEERARRQAEAVDRRVAAGEEPGPLAGVPITVKDILTVEGVRAGWNPRARWCWARSTWTSSPLALRGNPRPTSPRPAIPGTWTGCPVGPPAEARPR